LLLSVGYNRINHYVFIIIRGAKLQDYSLSFTAASLMHFEMEQVAALFEEHSDWKYVENQVVNENYLQKGTISTRKREFAEIKKRLKNTSTKELAFMHTCSCDELKLFCFYLCCQSYRLLYEFTIEVVRQKHLLYDYMLLNSDYQRFIDSKVANSPKLQSITEKTHAKIKQVIFKILEQAGLIDSISSKNIQKPYISHELESLIFMHNPNHLALLLYTDADIKTLQERVQ